MPYSGRINLTIGETELKEVEYFGEAMYSPVRRGKTGWGMAIEVPAVIELLQRCPSRVRMALAIDVLRLGLYRDLRKMRQDFSLATPRSTGARAAASAWLRDFSMG